MVDARNRARGLARDSGQRKGPPPPRPESPRASRGRGGDGSDVVGWGEADEREEPGDGEKESRRRAEDGEKVAPVAHRARGPGEG